LGAVQEPYLWLESRLCAAAYVRGLIRVVRTAEMCLTKWRVRDW